jgi:hypothetical protein
VEIPQATLADVPSKEALYALSHRGAGVRSRRLVTRRRGMFSAMIRQIAPQFFTTDLPATLAYYRDKLGFDC